MPSPDPAPRNPVIRLAGDADATPLFRYLVKVFSSRHPGGAIVVEDPIGSHGGLRALEVGALQGVILVGAPGPLYRERSYEVARTEAVLAVGSSVPDRALTTRALMETINGTPGLWPNGLVRGFLLRPIGDPLQNAFSASIPGIDAILRKAHSTRRWPALGIHSSMGVELTRLPGTVGIASLGNLRVRGAAVWTVPLTGHTTPRVPLSIVLGTKVSDRLAAFRDFMLDAEGQTLVSDLGFEKRVQP